MTDAQPTEAQTMPSHKQPATPWRSDYARSVQLRRTWQILALLRNGPRTIEGLARETGVSKRTVRRDLYALEAAGIPLYRGDGDHERGQAYRLVKGAPCPICGRGLASGKEYREP